MIVLIILNDRNFRIYSQNKVNKKTALKYYWTEPWNPFSWFISLYDTAI